MVIIRAPWQPRKAPALRPRHCTLPELSFNCSGFVEVYDTYLPTYQDIYSSIIKILQKIAANGAFAGFEDSWDFLKISGFRKNLLRISGFPKNFLRISGFFFGFPSKVYGISEVKCPSSFSLSSSLQRPSESYFHAKYLQQSGKIFLRPILLVCRSVCCLFLKILVVHNEAVKNDNVTVCPEISACAVRKLS